MNPARVARLLLAAACLPAMLRIRAAEPAPAAPLIPTVIESEGPLEMSSTETTSTFTFRDKVVVTGTNLKITCDRLIVITRRAGDPAATIGKQENFKSLVATGRVRIVQNDREALCDRAEIFPGEDKVELTGNLVVQALDKSWIQTGEKGTLYRGEKRVAIERPRITLPELKDLGFEKEPEKKKPGTPTITLPKADAPK